MSLFNGKNSTFLKDVKKVKNSVGKINDYLIIAMDGNRIVGEGKGSHRKIAEAILEIMRQYPSIGKEFIKLVNEVTNDECD